MLNNIEFQTKLNNEAAIILANIKFDISNTKETKKEQDYILQKNPIDRINQVKY